MKVKEKEGGKEEHHLYPKMQMASKQVLPDQCLHSVSTECGGRPYDNNRLGRKYEA